MKKDEQPDFLKEIKKMEESIKRGNYLFEKQISEKQSMIESALKPYYEVEKEIGKNISNYKHPLLFAMPKITDAKNIRTQITDLNKIMSESSLTNGIKADAFSLNKIMPKITFAINSNFEKFIEANKRIMDAQKRAAEEAYPKLVCQFEKIYASGWTLGMSFDNIEGVYEFSKTEEQLDLDFQEYYSKNSYHALFLELDAIVSFLEESDGEGFAKQLKELIKILEKDISNYIIAIPVLMPILEYITVYKAGNIKTKKYEKYYHLKDLLKEKKENKDVIAGIGYVNDLNTLKLLENMYGYAHFEKGIDGTTFTRHSVVHGRYDPLKYNKEQFMKLVVLISATCMLELNDGTENANKRLE